MYRWERLGLPGRLYSGPQLRRVLEVVWPGVMAVPPGVRIPVAAEPVDFREGMEAAALVQQALRRP